MVEQRNSKILASGSLGNYSTPFKNNNFNKNTFAPEMCRSNVNLNNPDHFLQRGLIPVKREVYGTDDMMAPNKSHAESSKAMSRLR